MVEQQSDVLVVGSGMAALTAATAAKAHCPALKVTVLTAGELGAGGCSKKIHGINAALAPQDSWERHVADTLTGGGHINDPDLVDILCREIPDRIHDLERGGVAFSRSADGVGYDVGTYGGSSVPRSVHWHDMTGLRIMQTLVNQVILSGCYVADHRWALDLLRAGQRCQGVIALNQHTGRLETHLATATILATGGGACVYPIATISADKVATGMIMSYHAGASLIDMEMVQFHPTGLVLPESPGHGEILEEEVRTWGGRLLNQARERYMLSVDPRGELATRDIVARHSYLEIQAGRGTPNNGVILDLSPIDKARLLQRFPHMVQRLRSWGVDLCTQSEVEISPTAHYLMGGIRITATCQTDLSGLFACGEDAGGIDGGNRLGGNGVAATLVFGHRAGQVASAYTTRVGPASAPPVSDAPIAYYALSTAEQRQVESALKRLMWDHVGLVRDAPGLLTALQRLNALCDDLQPQLRHSQPDAPEVDPEKLVSGKILLQKLTLARLITHSALARTNSVGAHYRTDAVPATRPYNVLVRTRGGAAQVLVCPRELETSTPSVPAMV